MINIVLKINTDNEYKVQDIKCSLAMVTSDMLRGGEIEDSNIRWIGLENYQN